MLRDHVGRLKVTVTAAGRHRRNMQSAILQFLHNNGRNWRLLRHSPNEYCRRRSIQHAAVKLRTFAEQTVEYVYFKLGLPKPFRI